MATGISKHEQLSPNAITATDHYADPIALPEKSATAHLSYPGKASVDEILATPPCILVDPNTGKEPAALVDTFALCDNLLALRWMIDKGQKANLIYLDPPYGTGYDFQSRDLEHAYRDSMTTTQYVEFMRRRLILMRELLSDDGSIYIHIGHQMVGHLKVLMDEIFGQNQFRNIITRRKCSSKNFTKKQYSNTNDFILFYSKSKNYTWNKPGMKPAQDWIEREYPKIDELGRRYKLVPIHAPGTRNGETGKEWRGMLPPPGKHWQYTPTRLDELQEAGDIYWSRNGNPRRKVYWTAEKRVALNDYWDQFRDAHHQSIKITGYPTEKNLDMMRLLVNASSNPDDLVLDPFCGSGTTLNAARDSGRRYVGLDASFVAAKATLKRLRHGTKAMGDYVNGTGREKRQELALAAPPFNDRNPTFILDERLILDFGENIRDLVEI